MKQPCVYMCSPSRSPLKGTTRQPYRLKRNFYSGQEATVKTGQRIADWFKMGKGVHQGCILSPLFNLHAEYIMQNVRLDDVQAGIMANRWGKMETVKDFIFLGSKITTRQ